MNIIEQLYWKTSQTFSPVSANCFLLRLGRIKHANKLFSEVRNYIKATRPANCSFKYPRKPYDMQVEVEVLHNNPDNLRITNTIDNSVP